MPLRLTGSRVETWMRTDDEQTSFQRHFVCADVLWLCKATVTAAAALGGLLPDHLGGGQAGCGSSWAALLHLDCGCEAGWTPADILAVTMQVNLPHLCHCAAQTAQVGLVLHCGQSGPRQGDKAAVYPCLWTCHSCLGDGGSRQEMCSLTHIQTDLWTVFERNKPFLRT